MASKASQRPSQRPSQPASKLTIALTNLCQYLREARSAEGDIKSHADAINPVNEALRAQRKSSTKIDRSFVIDIVSELDHETHTVCSRLDAKLYSVIIQILLESEDCRQGERGMYLLAAALYYDANSSPKKRSTNKKAAIGAECLHPLLYYFIDDSKPDCMRQWVGIMCLQLFQECDSNVQKFELGPEYARRKHGDLVLKEPNEIIRVICGQLITCVMQAGLSPEHLWPVDVDKQLYANFPTVSQSSRKWNRQFQTYMDNVFEILQPRDPIGQMYFVQNVSTTPSHNFGPEDHNIIVLLESSRMLIWSAAIADREIFDQSLEIPLMAIKKMLIKTRSESQLSGIVNVHLYLENRDGLCCYLDCVGNALDQICMVLQLSAVTEMRDELCALYPHLEVIEESCDSSQETGNQISQQGFQRGSIRSSRSDDAVLCNGDGSSQVRPQHLASLNNKKPSEPLPAVIPETQGEDDDISKEMLGIAGSDANGPQEELDELSDGSLCKTSKMQIIKSQTHASAPKKPNTRERKRRSVPKPKAKTPIWQTQKSKKDDSEPAPTLDGPASVKAAQTLSKELTGEKLREYTEKLGDEFPFTYTPTRRAAVLAFKGNYQEASDYLYDRFEDRSSPVVRADKVNGQVGSEPTANPEATDTLILKPATNGIEKKQSTTGANYAPGPTTTETQTRSEQLSKKLTGAKKGSPKKYSLNRTFKTHEDDNCYEISIEEDDEYQPTGPKNGSKLGAKLAKPLRSARKSAAVKPKLTKVDKKKRQSAPAALEHTSTATKTRRLAAAAASKKLKDMNNSDVEVQEVQGATPRSDKPDSGGEHEHPTIAEEQQQSESVYQGIQVGPINPDIPVDAEILRQQPDDARSLVFMQVPNQESDNLYDASPRKPMAKEMFLQATKRDKNFHATSKRGSKLLEDMASKMDNMLGHLEYEEAGRSPLVSNSAKGEKAQGTAAPSIEDVNGLKLSPANRKESLPKPIEEHNSKNNSKTPVTESMPALPTIIEIVSSPLDRNSKARSASIEFQTTPSIGKKRKSADITSTLRKRRRSNQDVENERYTPCRSPRIGATAQQKQPNGDSNTHKEPNEGSNTHKSKRKSLTPPTRRSPRLIARAMAASDILNSLPSVKVLVDDHIFRKPPVISFNEKGPRNQGPSSIPKSSARRPQLVARPRISPSGEDSVHSRKRKLEVAGDRKTASPSNKRQSISPEDDTVSNMEDHGFASSPPVPPFIEPASQVTAFGRKGGTSSRRVSKPSSQASRVDINGSPIAPKSHQIDRISKLKRRLLADRSVGSHAPEPSQHRGLLVQQSPGIFGPKLRLSSIPKARPSSPEETLPRYIAHKKTQSGSYEGINSNGLVVPETALADPFLDKPTNCSSDFTNRLLAGCSKAGDNPNAGSNQGKGITSQLSERAPVCAERLPQHVNKSLKIKGNSRLGKRITEMLLDETKQTFADAENLQESDISSPPELTSASTRKSLTELQSRSPLSDKRGAKNLWNLALRPHYENLSETMHRIADEVIIRLAKEEDIMELLVTQYKQNGNKILDKLAHKREGEKADMLLNLNHTKREMISIYRDAKGFADTTKQNIEKSPVAGLEKQWKKDREEVQRRIDQGRLAAGEANED